MNVIILYTVGFLGLIQYTMNVIPGVSDVVSLSAVVTGLASANIIQYRQAMKERTENRKIEAAFRREIADMRAEQMLLFKEVLLKIGPS